MPASFLCRFGPSRGRPSRPWPRLPAAPRGSAGRQWRMVKSVPFRRREPPAGWGCRRVWGVIVPSVSEVFRRKPGGVPLGRCLVAARPRNGLQAVLAQAFRDPRRGRGRPGALSGKGPDWNPGDGPCRPADGSACGSGCDGFPFRRDAVADMGHCPCLPEGQGGRACPGRRGALKGRPPAGWRLVRMSVPAPRESRICVLAGEARRMRGSRASA